MPTPSLNEMTAICLSAGTAQLLVALVFFLRSLRRAAPETGGAAPKVSVIVPCKGFSGRLKNAVQAFLRQDYPAGAEFIFVVPSASDPAYAGLGELLRGYAGTRLLVSNASPDACSEQILNMLCGVDNASPGAGVLVFADSDILVPPGWLSAMVRPLADPSAGAVTAPLVFLPKTGDLCANLRCVWEAAGIPYLDLLGCVAGASFSISRENFSALGVETAWRRSLNNDLSLARLVKKAGKRVVFAYGALPVSDEECRAAQLLRMLNKWMLYFRFYFPPVWVLGSVLTAVKFYAVYWSAARGYWAPAVILFAADTAYIYFCLRVLARLLPDGFSGRSGGRPPDLLPIAAACAPLLQLVYAVNIVNSCFASSLRWGGYTYRIRAGNKIEAEPLP